MGSFTRKSGAIAALALASAAMTATLPATQAGASAGGGPTIKVACDTVALAAAVNQGNARGGAVLVLPANCTYAISTPATGADGLPIITGNLTINGGPQTVITRDAIALFRILEVASGARLSLNGVTITNGNTAGLGGGILDGGALTVTRGNIHGNTAGNGGAVSVSAGATATIANTFLGANTATSVGGGAAINFGTLSVNGSTITGNQAPVNGGGVNTQPAGTTRVSQSTVTHNTSGGLGGGFSNLGTTVISGTLVQDNTGSSGGGVATGNANVTLLGSTVTSNTPDNCNPINTIQGCTN